MLPDEALQLWEAYLASERIRIRERSMEALDRFINTLLEHPPECWHPWALDLARRVVDGADQTTIRLPLFRSVLFPALRAGLEASTPGAARWLAGFSQLLYHSSGCSEQLPEDQRSEWGLLLRAISDDNSDIHSKRRLLKLMRSRIEYALHELPTGVLYGHNGASIEQCGEFLEELDDYKALANEIGGNDDAELISEARFHITAYRDYLKERNRYTNYAQYLSLNKNSSPIG